VGFMQWLRGSNDTTSAMLSAGMAEIDALFRPSKHKQTEHIEETKRRRVDLGNGTGIDLDRGIAIIRTSTGPVATEADPAGADPAETIPAEADAAEADPRQRRYQPDR